MMEVILIVVSIVSVMALIARKSKDVNKGSEQGSSPSQAPMPAFAEDVPQAQPNQRGMAAGHAQMVHAQSGSLSRARREAEKPQEGTDMRTDPLREKVYNANLHTDAYALDRRKKISLKAQELRRAVVMKEVLDPPKARRAR